MCHDKRQVWLICDVIRPGFFFQAEDGIRDSVASRGLGDVYKRQIISILQDLHRRFIVGQNKTHVIVEGDAYYSQIIHLVPIVLKLYWE